MTSGDGGSRTHAPLRTYRISSATSYDHLSTSPYLLTNSAYNIITKNREKKREKTEKLEVDFYTKTTVFVCEKKTWTHKMFARDGKST